MDENSLVTREKRMWAPLPQRSQGYFVRKTTAAFFSIILIGFLCGGCQKAKEPEQRKEVQVQKEEITQTPLGESKSLDPTRQEIKGSIQQKPKKEAKEIPLAKKPSPLTEEEQKIVTEIGENILIAPTEYFESQDDAVPYLKVLLKGDHRNVILYKGFEALGEDKKKQDYDEAMSKAVRALNPKTKVGFRLVVEVLKTKRGYQESISEAARAIKVSQDKSVIPLLREVAKNPSIKVRLEAAGSLLALGDADTALPVLDELAKEGATSALGFIFHNMQGKEWEQRGVALIKKALTYENKESRALAALFWVRLKKEDGDYIERLTINLLQGILKKEKWGGEERRACESAIYTLLEIRSKKSITVLQAIAKHPDASYIENRANKAILDLEKERSE